MVSKTRNSILNLNRNSFYLYHMQLSVLFLIPCLHKRIDKKCIKSSFYEIYVFLNFQFFINILLLSVFPYFILIFVNKQEFEKKKLFIQNTKALKLFFFYFISKFNWIALIIYNVSLLKEKTRETNPCCRKVTQFHELLVIIF